MRFLLAILAGALVIAGCSSDRTPESVCASPPPGETLSECKDFGEGEGPLRG
jgi:PBP1b-binding outer membrane lipoprotein LpoB